MCSLGWRLIVVVLTTVRMEVILYSSRTRGANLINHLTRMEWLMAKPTIGDREKLVVGVTHITKEHAFDYNLINDYNLWKVLDGFSEKFEFQVKPWTIMNNYIHINSKMMIKMYPKFM